MTNTLTRGILLASASTLAVTLSACSADSGSTESSASSGSSAASSSAEDGTMAEDSTMAEETTGSTAAAPAGDEPFGAGCTAVPADGEGSFTGMTDDPVATAASNNPVLSTLVQAVTQANLVDALNSAQDITVIAPANPAFEAVPADQLQAVLADNAQLTAILTHHVIEGRLSPDQLAGTHTTLAGDQVVIEGSGEALTVAQTVTGTPASVICGNVQTANATVYIVDQVLAPAAA